MGAGGRQVPGLYTHSHLFLLVSMSVHPPIHPTKPCAVRHGARTHCLPTGAPTPARETGPALWADRFLLLPRS